MRFAVVVACLLVTGCMAEVGSEDSIPLEDYEYSPSDWEGNGEPISVCRPFVRTIELNGETITVIEPAECPVVPSLDSVYIPPWEEQINQEDLVRPYDSLPFDKSIRTFQ